MGNALEVCLEILKLMPAPTSNSRKRSTSQIEDMLNQSCFKVTARNLQRTYLPALEKLNLLERTGDQYGGFMWARRPSVDALFSGVPDRRMAVLVALMNQTLAQIVPEEVMKGLTPIYRKSLEVLEKSTRASGRNWKDLIGTKFAGVVVSRPKLNLELLQTVVDAVLDERYLSIRVGSKDFELVEPMGLVEDDGRFALVHGVLSGMSIRHDYLDEILEARLEEEDCRPQKDYSVSSYVKSGFVPTWMGGADRAIKLVADFNRGSLAFLSTSPISDDQRLQEVDGVVRLTATVPSTSELERWLLGFGGHIDILEPTYLRRHLRRRAASFSGLSVDKIHSMGFESLRFPAGFVDQGAHAAYLDTMYRLILEEAKKAAAQSKIASQRDLGGDLDVLREEQWFRQLDTLLSAPISAKSEDMLASLCEVILDAELGLEAACITKGTVRELANQQRLANLIGFFADVPPSDGYGGQLFNRAELWDSLEDGEELQVLWALASPWGLPRLTVRFRKGLLQFHRRAMEVAETSFTDDQGIEAGYWWFGHSGFHESYLAAGAMAYCLGFVERDSRTRSMPTRQMMRALEAAISNAADLPL